MAVRPYNENIKNFSRMTAELSPMMTAMELEQIIEFEITINDSKHDINPSVEDSKTQLELILGKERYKAIVDQWKEANQVLLTEFGQLKYRYKKDGSLWDGLDTTDDPNDYAKIYV